MKTRILLLTLSVAVLAACSGSGSGSQAKTAPGPTETQTTAPTTAPTQTAQPKPTPTVVAGPALIGKYRVTVVVVTSNTERQPAGGRFVRTWTFTPLCPGPTCGVTLAREVGWSNPNGSSTTRVFRSAATRTSSGYHGIEHKPQQCQLQSGRVVTGPEQATLNYTIQVLKGPGTRPSFKGTATNTAPAQGGCRAVTQTFSFTGKPA
ncbi:MAG: hypothetical protein QOK42_500 [Frankiaceae bacterium]|jgi:hypothetical protein|nr:hypothetical protein [Frankiaceae bacterium]